MTPTQYILEKRHPDGTLDFSDPQPPFITATLDKIFEHYFDNHPNAHSASPEQVREWYANHGFKYRQKTW